LSLPIRTTSLLCVLLFARPVVAQDRPVTSATESDGAGQWMPLGPIPVDQAGAGRRGYVLAGENTEVAEPGAHQISIHAVAANNFYLEQNDSVSISQRYETHTAALGYRRGFKIGMFPRFELGGQLQLTEGGNGFMNGFIWRTEKFLTWLSGRQSATNLLRHTVGTQPPLGTLMTKNGQPVYRAAGDRSGFGDFSIVAKALLRDAEPSSRRTRVAVRVAMNISGTSEFTAGNFTGIGVSVDKKILQWAAVHGDVRANYFLDRVSQWNLPLKHGSLAFTVGPELKLANNSSISAQMDGSTTPYLAADATAFDRGYGAVTFGFNHRFRTQQRQVVAQFYLRENMNLPFRVRWNTDPDLSLGIKFTIRSAPH
jgi:hypothetical protein